jgi:hypothetical protein
MKKIILFFFVCTLVITLTISCSKSSSDETQTTTAVAFSTAFNGVYTGTGSSFGSPVTGVVTLNSSTATTGSYVGDIGNVLLSEIASIGGSNFTAKNKLSGAPITLSFSGADNKTLKIVAGTSNFTGTKP